MVGESPSPQAEIASVASAGRQHIAGEGSELWSSKELNLLWLPRCDNWTSPSLHRNVAADQPPAQQDVAHEWHWRVDNTFAAWVIRAIHRADSAKADLPSSTRAAFLTICDYITGLNCWSWFEIERSAAAGPVRLTPIDDVFNHLALWGFSPVWGKPRTKGAASTGWYAWYEQYDADRTAAVQSLPSIPDYRPSPATSARHRKVDDGLFRTPAQTV